MKKGLFFAIIFQISVLSSLLLFAYLPLYFGKEIKMKAQGVDPRDMFLGNYVALRYDINTIISETKYKENQIIYISLKKENDLYIKDKISLEKPKSGDFIKGRVAYSHMSEKENIYKNHLKFGIEKYFTTKENARILEKKLIDKNATITLRILNANARIDGLLVD